MGKKVDLTEEQVVERLAELGLLKASMEYKRQKRYFNNLKADPEAELEQAGEEEREVRKEYSKLRHLWANRKKRASK